MLLDDRAQSPGSKLKDADLIGLPVQVIVGKVWQAQGQVEVVERASKAKQPVPPSAVLSTLPSLVGDLRCWQSAQSGPTEYTLQSSLSVIRNSS